MNKIIIANWKMKLGIKKSLELARQYVSNIKSEDKPSDLAGREIVICSSEIVLKDVSEIIKDSAIKLGAQNVFWEEKGSYTGEVSASMLTEVGCEYVIIGHSERRQYLLENYQMIHQKIKAVLAIKNLTPIICIGETLQDKEEDKRDYVITDQLQQALGGISLLAEQQLVVAYEPIWAIGTGQVIEPADAENMHEIIHAVLVDLFGIDIVKNQIRVIYGGSVNAENVKGFSDLDNIDGFLIGGASLKIGEFINIIKN